MNLADKILLILILCFMPVMAAAQETVRIPDDVKPFVLEGMEAIELETADLNGDGTIDYILVLGEANVKPEDRKTNDSDRPILIITRGKDGKLRLAARNDNAALCESCGGRIGDAFNGIKVKQGSFTIYNSGGSRDRWDTSAQFNYSSRDRTWQLVRVRDKSFDIFKKSKDKIKISTPPKDFGKINFADFEPFDFAGKGAK